MTCIRAGNCVVRRVYRTRLQDGRRVPGDHVTKFLEEKILLQKWLAYEQNFGKFFEKIQKNPTCQVLKAVQNPATSNVIWTSDSGR